MEKDDALLRPQDGKSGLELERLLHRLMDKPFYR